MVRKLVALLILAASFAGAQGFPRYSSAGGGSGVKSFFGAANTGVLTALVDPTTITDAAGNTISFSSGAGGTISFTDVGGDTCVLASITGITCTDSSNDALVLNGGDFQLTDTAGDSVESIITGTLKLTDSAGDECDLSSGSFNCNIQIQATNSPLSGTSGSIGGSLLAAGACSSGTVSVTGATTAMGVIITPVPIAGADPGNSTFWKGYVSTAGTVTVKVCESVAGTPTATTYNVRVIP